MRLILISNLFLAYFLRTIYKTTSDLSKDENDYRSDPDDCEPSEALRMSGLYEYEPPQPPTPSRTHRGLLLQVQSEAGALKNKASVLRHSSA